MPKRKNGRGSKVSVSHPRKRIKGQQPACLQGQNSLEDDSCTESSSVSELPSANPFALGTPADAFARLVHPMVADDFFRQHWEKRPAVLTASREDNRDFFASLFSREVLGAIVATKRVSFVRDCNVCRYRAQKRESLNGKGIVTPSQLKDLLDKSKATVQFHQPQRFQDSIWQLLERLESYFGCLVGSNVYMTPGGSQGLAPHYDDVEVFVLQLEGEKRWRLYDPPVALPRDYSRDLDQSEIGKPTFDVTLKAGDVMYFPRGTVHQAETPGTCRHSTHLTISTYQRASWADLLAPALPSLLQSAVSEIKALREGLPLGLCCGPQAFSKETTRKVKELVSQIGRHVRASHCQDAANEMLCDFVANRLPPYSSDPADLVPCGPVPSVRHRVRLRFPGHSFVILRSDDDSDDDDDDAEEEDEEDEEDGDSFKLFVYHSLGNRCEDHMMASEPKKPQGVQLPRECEAELRRLHALGGEFVNVKDLALSNAVRTQALTSLWAEGLLEVQEIGAS